jgi:hypothetical protein
MPEKRVVRRRAARPKSFDGPDEPEANGDEEERPRPTKKAAAASRDAKTKHLREGWTEGQKTMDSTSSFAASFKPEEKVKGIKFLQDGPYVSYRRHWVDTMNEQREKVTRAYTCLQTVDEDCPLCEIGQRAQAVSAFNIAECGDDGQVLLRSWDVGARLFNTLKGYANDPKIGPLTKGFFVISKTGKKQNTSYNVIPVKGRDLEEDYDIPVPSQDDLDGLVLYTVEIVDIPTKKFMRELAEELVDEYE